MQWLLDSDVIWKLATFDLLNELLGVLDAKKPDLFCLPELRYQLKSAKFLEKQSRDAIQRVIEFVKGVKTIEKIDPAEQVILQVAKASAANGCSITSNASTRQLETSSSPVRLVRLGRINAGNQKR
jgi:hypothetical protein